MSPLPVPPLPPGCPWSDWTPPNIKWCEDNLCGWITAPANTYSNLAYFLVAALLWRRRPPPGSLLRFYAPACLFLGTASSLFHASYTLFFQFFDYLGMFVVLAMILSINLRRQGVIQASRAGPVFGLITLALAASIPPLHHLGFPYQLLIVVLALAVLAQEALLSRTKAAAPGYRWFWISMAFLFTAAACLALDFKRCWCDPDNHWVQFHGLWHVLSAASLYAAYHFFDEVERSAPGPQTGPLASPAAERPGP